MNVRVLSEHVLHGWPKGRMRLLPEAEGMPGGISDKESQAATHRASYRAVSVSALP